MTKVMHLFKRTMTMLSILETFKFYLSGNILHFHLYIVTWDTQCVDLALNLLPVHKKTEKSLVHLGAQCGAGEGHAPLIKTVVLARALTLRLKVHSEQELRSGGI